MNDSLSILIVDDIPENIQVAANLLKDEGYDIAFALDGSTAIEHLKNHYYDLVLLDIMMPGMDGFEVCSRMKEDEATENIPVIFLTAKHDIESVKKGFKLGAVDYVSKPFNAEELLVRVNNHIKLVQQQRELQRMNRNQQRFLSLVSHDVKEPFSGVLGFSKLLKNLVKDCENQKIKQYTDLIYLSAINGFNLLNNILEWSRSELGVIKYNPDNQSLKEIMEAVKEQQMFNLQRKSITLDEAIEHDALRCDKNMLMTILRNLIANAIKYSEENSRIQVYTKSKEGGIAIAVADNGVGMTEAQKDKLFKLDDQISTPGTKDEKGSGVGLALSLDFARRHGGDIQVESEEGQGSTFTVFIPQDKK